MSYSDDYEYHDDEEFYDYEDEDDYIDYDEEDGVDGDDESVGSSGNLRDSIRPFGGGSSRFGGGGLPGSSSSGSRFGSGDSPTSRFGGGASRFGDKKDDAGTGSGSSSTGFGGGSGALSRFGDKKDDAGTGSSSSSSSRFGNSSTSRFSGGGSSRFGSDKGDPPQSPGGSGQSTIRPSFKKDDKSGQPKSPTPADKKDDKGDDSGGGLGGLVGGLAGRFGGGGDKKDDKSAAKKDAKSDDSGGGLGGLVGGLTGRFGGSDKKDDKSAAKKDDKGDDSGGGLGGLVGGLAGRFGGGGDKKDDKSAAKKDAKSDDSGGGGLGGLVGGFAGRFGGGGDKKDDKSAPKDAKGGAGNDRMSRFGSRSKDDNKPGNQGSSAPASRFGGARKGDAGSTGDNQPASKKPSPFGRKASTDAKGDKSGGKKDDKAAATTRNADSSGGVFGRLTSAVGGIFGGGGDKESAPAPRRTRTPKVPTTSEDGLTLDNWLDIIGVGLVFVSLVLFFSAISQEQAAIAVIHNFIGEMFGWGALSVPVTMFIVGMWLIVRHFGDDAPTVDPVRVAGVVTIFVGVLIIFQYIDSFSYRIPSDVTDTVTLRAFLRTELEFAWDVRQSGGGWIGAQLYYLLVTSATEIGGFILTVFLMSIGAMLLTRQSPAELLRAGLSMWLTLREGMKQRAVRKRAERQLAAQRVAQQPVQQAQTQAPPVAVPNGADVAREIRMTVGGQAQTVPMGTGAPAQGVPTPNYNPVMTPQAAPQNSNGGNGLFGSLFGRSGNNGQPASVPAPPADLPAAPLPMDDGFSHFDTGPVRTTAAAPAPPEAPPQRLGDMLGADKSGTARPAAAESPAPPPVETPAAPAQQPAASADNAQGQETGEVDDFLKQRQARLNALREGKAGPLSQSALARARHEDVESAFVPASESEKERTFQRGVGDAARAEAAPAANNSNNDSFSRPSELPSVQPDGDNSPRQQMLAVPVDEPKSSPVKNQTRPRAEWKLPDYSTLFSTGSEQEFDRERLLKQAKTIEETLEAFGAPGRVVEVNTGPVITQFGVEPDYISGRGGRKQRVKVSAIAGLDKDMQLALGARSIRVEAPVPGKGYVGIEVPNAESTLVSLRDVMDSPGFAKHQSPLAIALGQSVSGAPISADLSTMPHLLIAGTTGSGKSVCVNSIIASILTRNTPEQVKFIMVDPKRVELTGYNGIPHLVAPVVVELERIVGVLKWVTREMDDRYKRFSEAGARNIDDYNKHRDPNNSEQMPYMIVIIDELADLMMLAPEETERTITRIAALARATGIHLVIATQRPSVDVVTGLIKANFPARIAFAVAGSVDSRVILDQPGAERLLGKGDMLYLSGDSPAPLRLQGVYVSDMEITNIVRYWKMQSMKQPKRDEPLTLTPRFTSESTPESSKRSKQNAWAQSESASASDDDLPLFAAAKRNAEAPQSPEDDVELTRRELTGDVKEGNEDELYEKAVELVRRLDKASISLLQRRLRIGYTRAARLIDVMEARGVVGPSKDGSSKPRDVLPER